MIHKSLVLQTDINNVIPFRKAISETTNGETNYNNRTAQYLSSLSEVCTFRVNYPQLCSHGYSRDEFKNAVQVAVKHPVAALKVDPKIYNTRKQVRVRQQQWIPNSVALYQQRMNK